MSTPIILSSGNFASDFCWPNTPAEFWPQAVALLSGFLNQDFPGVYIGETEPDAIYRDRAWLKPSVTKWYYWINGAWMREYEEPASSGRLIAWRLSDALLKTYAGGSDEAVSDTTGPLWLPATDYDGRILVGMGVIPTSDPAVTLGLGDTGGEHKHSLIDDEMPPHTHDFTVLDGNSAGSGTGRITSGTLNKTPELCFSGTTENAGGVSDGAVPPTYTVTPHENMPPYKAVRWAYRSARRYIFPPY